MVILTLIPGQERVDRARSWVVVPTWKEFRRAMALYLFRFVAIPRDSDLVDIQREFESYYSQTGQRLERRSDLEFIFKDFLIFSGSCKKV